MPNPLQSELQLLTRLVHHYRLDELFGLKLNVLRILAQLMQVLLDDQLHLSESNNGLMFHPLVQ